MRASTRFAPCALAEMHRCLAPCDGRVGPERYEELVRSLISSLSTPGGLLGTLEARMRDLAEQERFEEAALARDRLRALAEALAQVADRRLAAADRRPGPARRGGPPLPPPARRADPGRRRRAPRGAVSARARGRALRAPRMGGSQRGPRRVERRAVRGARRGRRRAPPAARDAPRPRPDRRRTLGRRLDWLRWRPRSSSRARARRSAASSVRSPSCPPSTSACSPPRRRCVAPASSPTRSTRRSSVTLARRATARTPAAR